MVWPPMSLISGELATAFQTSVASLLKLRLLMSQVPQESMSAQPRFARLMRSLKLPHSDRDVKNDIGASPQSTIIAPLLKTFSPV